MFVRNFLRPGDYLTMMPIGLNVTLQYDRRGVLEKVFKGFEDREDITKSVLSAIQKNLLVPQSIPLKDATSWIQGTFTTREALTSLGKFPDAIENTIIQSMNTSPSSIVFFAGRIESNVVNFSGIGSIRNWLKMNKFNLAGGCLLPVKLNSTILQELAKNHMTSIIKLIQTYIVYRGTEVLYKDTGLEIRQVKKVDNYVDENGNIYVKVKLDNKSYLTMPYGDCVHFNICPTAQVILDEDGRIAGMLNNTAPAVPHYLVCKYCGNQIQAVYGGDTVCPNPSCESKLYHKIKHFLNRLNMPMLDYQKYTKYQTNASSRIASVLEIFNFSEYSHCAVQVTLAELLDALIPADELSNRAIIGRFTGMCNNVEKTVLYYSEYSDRILDKFPQSEDGVMDLVNWFDTDDNLRLFKDCLAFDSIQIVESNTKFSGDPIFRGTKIMITGLFSHGDIESIRAILNSYSATVCTIFEPGVNFVVVGDIHEDIRGQDVRLAIKSRIPVYSESEFFERYKIDQDLKENL